MRICGAAQVDDITAGRLSNVRATKLLTERNGETCPGVFRDCSLPDNAIPEAETPLRFIDETSGKSACGIGTAVARRLPLHGPMMLDMFRQDLRFAWRGFMRTPGFLAVAVATLGLGIG